MEAFSIMLREISSIALDWALVLTLFAAQAFVATSGVQSLVG